jgi:hypothetical protein
MAFDKNIIAIDGYYDFRKKKKPSGKPVSSLVEDG